MQRGVSYIIRQHAVDVRLTINVLFNVTVSRFLHIRKQKKTLIRICNRFFQAI